MAPAHAAQKVHSKLQIVASPSGASFAAHRSQLSRISRATIGRIRAWRANA
jgi:hypothetical protein